VSRIITIKHDKGKLVSQIDDIMSHLTRDAISPDERTATATHLASLHTNAKPWEVSCVLQGDQTGRTKLTIMIAPRG